MDREDYDYLFKIMVLGNSGVGKTNIVARFLRGEFNLNSKSTIGIEYGSRVLMIEDNVIKGEIWDTAGAERYRAITTAYYRGRLGILLVYDVTKYESFENLKFWMKEINDHADSRAKVILIGNKNDLESKRQVPLKVGKEFAASCGYPFFETSAMDSVNVELAFKTIFKEIFIMLHDAANPRDHIKTNAVILAQIYDSSEQKRSGCC